MKTILLLLLATFAFQLNAQLLTDAGNQWNIMVRSQISGDKLTYRLAIGDEFELEGLTYRQVLQNSNASNNNWHPNGAYLRQEGDKVYQKSPNFPEFLLYDFGLQVGEYFVGQFCDMEVLAVENVTLVDGQVRKRLKMRADNIDIIDTYWIDGIGSAEYGLLSHQDICGTDYAERLLCFFEEEDVNFPSATAECIILKIKEVKDAEVRIFPNPATSDFNISNNEDQFTAYNLMDISGKIVLENTLKSGNNLINVVSLKSGFYTLTLQARTGNVVSKRLIIQ